MSVGVVVAFFPNIILFQVSALCLVYHMPFRVSALAKHPTGLLLEKKITWHNWDSNETRKFNFNMHIWRGYKLNHPIMGETESQVAILHYPPNNSFYCQYHRLFFANWQQKPIAENNDYIILWTWRTLANVHMEPLSLLHLWYRKVLCTLSKEK